MNWTKLYIITLLTITVVLIFFGQINWNQRLLHVAADSNSMMKDGSTTIQSNVANPMNVGITKLMIDYEEKFAEVITNYQDDVQSLYNIAESEYYQTYASLDHLMFRKFVSNNMKEIDSIYDQARLEYDKIYQQFSQELTNIGYTYNDHVIYYILFEEITMETHTTFVTNLINLQNKG